MGACTWGCQRNICQVAERAATINPSRSLLEEARVINPLCMPCDHSAAQTAMRGCVRDLAYAMRPLRHACEAMCARLGRLHCRYCGRETRRVRLMVRSPDVGPKGSPLGAK